MSEYVCLETNWSYVVTPIISFLFQDVIFQDKEKLLLFLNQMTKWLEEPLNYRRAINSLTKFDSNGDNKVSSDDFIIALRMAEVCCNYIYLVLYSYE